MHIRKYALLQIRIIANTHYCDLYSEIMCICNNAYLQIRIIANTHYCDPDSSPLSTSDSELCLSTLNSHTENWVWDYFQSAFKHGSF